MLNKIIYYSLHNRLVVLICALLLMIAGTYTAFHTDVDVFPDLNAPTVVIMKMCIRDSSNLGKWIRIIIITGPMPERIAIVRLPKWQRV